MDRLRCVVPGKFDLAPTCRLGLIKRTGAQDQEGVRDEMLGCLIVNGARLRWLRGQDMRAPPGAPDPVTLGPRWVDGARRR